MEADQIIDLVNKFGFPIISAGGMGYFIFYIYKFITTNLTPVIKDTSSTLVSLIDRVRMMDNDLIRLQQKINVAAQIKEDQKK